MPTPQPTLNSNYAGEQAGAYVGACVKSGLTLSEGNITFLENVKYKRNLTVVDTSSIISLDKCTFEPGLMSLTDRVIEPIKYKLNLELCKRNLEADWQAANMQPGVVNSGMSTDFTDFVVGYLGGTVGEDVENKIWADLKATALADPTVLDVANPVQLSVGNIIAEIKKLYALIPAKCYGKEGLTIYLGTAALKFYIEAMSSLGYMQIYYAAEIPLQFQGVKIAHAPGMAANTMMASVNTNFYAATDLVSDFVNLTILDMSQLDASSNLRIAMNYSIAANHAVGKDVVLYGV